MTRQEAREKKDAEAVGVKQEMEALSYQVLYGGRKGHGFWVHGQGWARMNECKRMIAQKVTP